MSHYDNVNDLIADLQGKLGNDASIELIDGDFDAEPTMPAELLAMIEMAAKEIAEALGIVADGQLPEGAMTIAAIDGSEEARQAMRELSGRMGAPTQRGCYHYILDDKGNPVHCEDEQVVRRFVKHKLYRLAKRRFDFGLKMCVETGFIVHNPMVSDVPPEPHWITLAAREDTDEIAHYWLSHSAAEARDVHRKFCDTTGHTLAQWYRLRRPSPRRIKVAQRRAQAGQDVLRGRRGAR